jgi:hypothetical protein
VILNEESFLNKKIAHNGLLTASEHFAMRDGPLYLCSMREVRVNV